MGSYDGAEICDLVGLYLLSQLQNLKLNIGLYRDDGLVTSSLKPNDTPLYINKQSNHPPSILKNIAPSVNKRLSSISANEDVFNDAAKPYQEALKNSGFEHKLKFQPEENNGNKNKCSRKRNISWFNPHSHVV